MSDQVLSDEQLLVEFNRGFNSGESGLRNENGRRFIERATISALAARSGVDVEAIATTLGRSVVLNIRTDSPLFGDRPPTQATQDEVASAVGQQIAKELHIALATAEARHAEREAMWRQFYNLIDGRLTGNNRDDLARAIELRAALGLA